MTTRTTILGSAGVSSVAVRYAVVATLVAGAFFGAYRFASARSNQSPDGGAPFVPASIGQNVGGDASVPATPGCACCGSAAPTENGVTGELVEGVGKVAGGVQRIDVDLSKGYYDPNVIVLEAGVPAEITFGRSAGCTAQVMSKDLGFFEDLSTGPATVELPALDAGEYAFSCGMEMVFGKILVR